MQVLYITLMLKINSWVIYYLKICLKEILPRTFYTFNYEMFFFPTKTFFENIQRNINSTKTSCFYDNIYWGHILIYVLLLIYDINLKSWTGKECYLLILKNLLKC